MAVERRIDAAAARVELDNEKVLWRLLDAQADGNHVVLCRLSEDATNRSGIR